MKKKMMLLSYEFTTGAKRFNQWQVVSLRFEGTKTENEEKAAATEALTDWFKKTYPESELQSVVPWPTIYADIPGKSVISDGIVTHVSFCDGVPSGWFTNDVKPFHDGLIDPEDGAISDEVLIDLDGKRENFVVGCWHFPHGKSEGWWRIPEFYESSLQEENMRWSYLPLAKYEKR